MRTWKIGESVCFKWEDGTRQFGKVVDLYASYGEIDGYEVDRENNGGEVRVSPEQMVDFEDISRLVSEALERIHAEDRRKSELLFELLGELGFYSSEAEGVIRYRYNGVRHQVSVSEIVAKYRKRAETAPQPPAVSECRHGFRGCEEPHETGESQCHCGCLNHVEAHTG